MEAELLRQVGFMASGIGLVSFLLLLLAWRA